MKSEIVLGTLNLSIAFDDTSFALLVDTICFLLLIFFKWLPFTFLDWNASFINITL